jgi:hypothetical protein
MPATMDSSSTPTSHFREHLDSESRPCVFCKAAEIADLAVQVFDVLQNHFPKIETKDMERHSPLTDIMRQFNDSVALLNEGIFDQIDFPSFPPSRPATPPFPTSGEWPSRSGLSLRPEPDSVAIPAPAVPAQHESRSKVLSSSEVVSQGPSTQDSNANRESLVTTTAEPVYIPPNLTVPTFRGRQTDNFITWLFSIENFFKLGRIPERWKMVYASSGLRNAARQHYISLWYQNGQQDLSWNAFRDAFSLRYHTSELRQMDLQDMLRAVRYKGVKYMDEYIEEFRNIEMQIMDTHYTYRRRHFLSKLPRSALNIS